MATAEAGITGNEFIDKLLEQAPPSASQPRHGQNYNYPPRLYLKPDGTVVALQGDPQNRAYYQDKGYHLLSDAPGRAGAKSEVRQYVEDEYPKILAEQKEIAQIINTIRKQSERDKSFHYDDDFDGMSLEEVRAEYARIQEDYGKPIHMIQSRRKKAAEDAAAARLLQGVETGKQTAEGLQAKIESSRPDMAQGTGYDPLEQARRRRS